MTQTTNKTSKTYNAVFMTTNQPFNQETNVSQLTQEEWDYYMDPHTSIKIYSYMRYWRIGSDPSNDGYHFYN